MMIDGRFAATIKGPDLGLETRGEFRLGDLTALDVDTLAVSRGGKPVLQGLDLTVRRGEVPVELAAAAEAAAIAQASRPNPTRPTTTQGQTLRTRSRVEPQASRRRSSGSTSAIRR